MDLRPEVLSVDQFIELTQLVEGVLGEKALWSIERGNL
jgi:hypothetical protein